MMEYVTRINLKTCCLDRRELIDFCLHGDEQYLAIGWSHVHGANKGGPALDTYSDYYYAVKNSVKRINPALNIFWSAGEDDLFWTSFWVTFKFAFIQVPIKLTVALLVAMVLARATRLTSAYRAAFYIPSLMGGSVAIALLWKLR